MEKEKLITLENVSKHFRVGPRQTLVAVNNISLDIYKGAPLPLWLRVSWVSSVSRIK